eukprot:14299808-Alexandrium_andersonii.AAC.1
MSLVVGAPPARTPHREAPLAPPPARFVSGFGVSAKQRHGTHPPGASDGSVEAVSGPAQVPRRTPQAILH